MPAPRLLEMACNYNCGCVGACQGVRGDEKPRCAGLSLQSAGCGYCRDTESGVFQSKVHPGRIYQSDQTAFGFSATVDLIAAFTSDRTRVR